MDQPIFEKKNVLITGGAGFIGSHLCDALVKEAKVICVDNFITGQESNIDHLLKNPNFEFIKADITQDLNLEDLPELKKFKVEFQGIQEIYNLACPTSPKEYNKVPLETLLTNAIGTYKMLELARKYKARFLHLSSSAIYGEPPEENVVIPESYWGFVDPIGPRSCYTEGKRFAESLIMTYQRKYELDVKIIRVFNTFGPRMKLDDGRMIPDFIKAALTNQDLVIYGDGREESTYLYISDLIEAILKMMKSNFTGPVNIGNTEFFTIKEIAQKIIKLCNSSSQIKYTDPLPYSARQTIPDITLAKEKLGWFPLVHLEEGLKKTIEYMEAQIGLKKMI